MSRFEQRRKKLLRLVRKNEADSILVTNEVNVTYLTGFTGDSSWLLLTKTHAILISDARFTQQIDEECPGLDAHIRTSGQGLADAALHLAKKAKPKQVAVEASSLTLATYELLTEKLESLELVPTKSLVEELRNTKDADEIRQIREAVGIAEKAFAVIKAALKPEQTEKQLFDEIEHHVRLFGGWCTAFPPIVGVGPRAALPHAVPTATRVGEADFVLIDWGARGQLYVSDLTRMLFTGRISPKVERIYRVVLKANQAGIAAIRPGAVMEDVDRAARQVIEKAGFGKQFSHSLGHGIGLEVHEGVRLAQNQKGKLEPGMVVTVEPGIYLPGWGGVRIEDDVLVTRDGHEVLSTVSKELEDCIAA